MVRSKFGSIQYIGRDKYRVFWTDINGKRKSKRISGTRNEAESYLAGKMLEQGIIEDVTYNSFWENVVYPSCEGLSERTKYDYTTLWNKHLKPHIGNTFVSSTNRVLVDSVLSIIDSPTTQRYVFRLWRKICNMAVDYDLLIKCPLGKRTILKPYRKSKKELIDSTELKEWLKSIENIKYEPILLCELGGGLRPEEAIPLLWEDIKEYEKDGRIYAIIDVFKALTIVGGKRILKDTKNTFSEREVVIGEPFSKRLIEIKSKGALCKGRIPITGELTADNFTSPVTISHNLRLWCDRNNVKYVCPKNLRSTYATLHGEAGSIDSVVSASMGHKDGTTKGKNYQTITRKALISIADNLTEYIESL